MSWVAVAVAGSAVVGAIASNSAANKQAASAKKGLNQSADLAAQSRKSAIDLFNRANQAQTAGQKNAFDFYRQSAQSRYSPFIKGNMAAQGMLGQGATQANNAILGLPVDMSAFNKPQQIQYDTSFLQNAKLPEPQANLSEPQSDQPAAANKTSSDPYAKGYAGGLIQDPRANLDPKNALLNPLGTIGVGNKITDKINPVKKLIKLF